VARRLLHCLGMNTARRPEQVQSASDRNLAWRVLAVLFVAALAAALVWSLGAEDRAIARMDPIQRRAVYERALGEVQVLCGTSPATDPLEKRCAEQLQFIVKFPECDATCQEIARSHTPRPTK
jgi:cytochrome b pre-mRNA-processing protein 3